MTMVYSRHTTASLRYMMVEKVYIINNTDMKLSEKPPIKGKLGWCGRGERAFIKSRLYIYKENRGRERGR